MLLAHFIYTFYTLAVRLCSRIVAGLLPFRAALTLLRLITWL